MVKPLDQFPLHILSNILGNISDAKRKDCQISALRVCSAFFLAAIPQIYRDSHVTGYANLSSFLLPIPLDPSVPLDNLSSSELVKMGHTKLAALRHVHHIHVIFEPQNDGIYRDFSRMSQEDRQKAYLSEKEELDGDIEKAAASIKALSMRFTPNIESIQIGEKLYLYESHPHPRAAELANLLIAAVAPRVWCQYHDWRITYPIHDIGISIPLPPILYRHIRTFGSLSIVPGTTNYIYIHREPLTIRSRAKPRMMIVERTCGFGAPNEHDLDDLSQCLKWEILDSFSITDSESNPQIQATIKKTKIIIGGAAPKSGLWLSEAEEVDELGGAKAIVKEIKKGLMEENKQLGGVQIEAVRAGDMGPCPGCGVGLTA